MQGEDSEKSVTHEEKKAKYLSGKDSAVLSTFESLDIDDLQKRNRFLEDTRRAIFNILEDVSSSEQELKKKTEELQKFRQAVDTSFDHTIITDADGRILYANRAAEVLTGYAQEEMLGKTPALWGKQMPREFYETFWRTIKIEKNGYAGEMTNKRKNGTKYLASLRVGSVLDEKGEVKFFVGVERDITEERKFQLRIVRHAAELEQANTRIVEEKDRSEKILQMLKSLGEGVFATDEAERIIFMNERAEYISGKTLKDVENNTSSEIFSFLKRKEGASQVLRMAQTTLARKSTFIFPEGTFLILSNKEIPVSGACSPIRNEKQEIIGTVTIFQDITKKHELDQMKDTFLSVAAHQLRTPLGSMRWSMELLLDGDLGKLPKGALEVMQQIYNNSERMILLVDDLLDMARMTESKGREEKRMSDIGIILGEVVKVMNAEGKRRGVKIIFKKPSTPLPLTAVSPKHFYEAFENLISNALKYNKENGSVMLTLNEKPDKFLITVTDTGIGIPKEDQSSIFSKFFRAKNAVLKETEGSGLGLSVVKSYLEESGASIRFESTEGVGTTFFVELPIQSTKSTSIPKE